MANASDGLAAAMAGRSVPDTAAVRIARKAFKTPATKAPWSGAAAKESTGLSAITAAAAAVRSMRTIIDPVNTREAKGSGDVETSFITYRALGRLKSLADAAQRAGLSESERTALQKAFSKGLTDLRTFLGNAPSDLVTIAFGEPTTHVKGAPALMTQDVSEASGRGVVATATTPISGLTGKEMVTIQLDAGTRHDTVSVDLSKLGTNAPTLEQIAEAFNDATAAAGNGFDYGVKFSVAQSGDKYGLAMTATGTTVSIQQADAGDALMVVSGRQTSDSKGPATIYRVTDTNGTLERQAVGSITATDRNATATAQAKAQARADALAQKTGTKSDSKAPLPTVLAALHAQGSTTGADGFTYVVGTTRGDMGTYRSKGNEDVFLTKVDSEGTIVWQHALGVSGSAQGAAVKLAPNGDVVVSGTVSGPFDGNRGENSDMLVARYSASGEKQFATSLPYLGDDQATSIAIGGDGSIYLGGHTATANGGGAYLARLDEHGKLVETRTIATAGVGKLNALAIDPSGNLLALTREGDNTRLRRIDPTNLGRDLATVDLGGADARAITVGRDGTVVVAGATSVALPDTAARPAGRGTDGFVTVFRGDLTGARTIYIGAEGEDQVDSVAIMGSKIYVGGRTTSDLDGKRQGKVDGFVAGIDTASGQVGSISQFGVSDAITDPVMVSAAEGGATTLGALGLHRGALNGEVATSLAAQFGVVEGDSFKVQLDNSTPRRISIDANETLGSLKRKILRLVGSTAISVTTPKNADGYAELTVSVKQGHAVRLIAGPTGKDALTKLGLDPIRLRADTLRKATDPKVVPGGRYGLSLSTTLSLSSAAEAKTAFGAITSAISITQTAYRSLYWDQFKAARVNGGSGSGSSYQQAQLASYQAALARLTAGNGGGGGFF